MAAREIRQGLRGKRPAAARHPVRRQVAKHARLQAAPGRATVQQPRKEVTSMALDDVYETDEE